MRGFHPRAPPRGETLALAENRAFLARLRWRHVRPSGTGCPLLASRGGRPGRGLPGCRGRSPHHRLEIRTPPAMRGGAGVGGSSLSCLAGDGRGEGSRGAGGGAPTIVWRSEPLPPCGRGRGGRQLTLVPRGDGRVEGSRGRRGGAPTIFWKSEPLPPCGRGRGGGQYLPASIHAHRRRNIHARSEPERDRRPRVGARAPR